jgi:molecular chaperone GrpE
MKANHPKGPRRIEITTPDAEGSSPGEASRPAEPTECPFAAAAPEGPTADVPLAPQPMLPEGGAADEELAKLQEMLGDLERKCAYAEDQHLRVAAELQNYKRRVQQEREQLVRYANEGLIAELIPIVDNFERALDVPVDSAGSECLMAGVRMIYDQLLRLLTGQGVQRIECLGADFDPHLHEAVDREETMGLPPGIITAEIAKGYTLNGRVIRPAKVRVTAQPAD